MIDKLDYYDVLGIVIPGVLLAYWLPICFPQAVKIAATGGFPDAVDIIGFVAISVFVGQLLQAVASSAERFIYWTWGGRPSDRVFVEGLGDRYLSLNAAHRIREALRCHVSPNANERDLFRQAIAIANASAGSRTERFNALYAYHRVLVVAVALALVLLATSRFWGAAEEWPAARFWSITLVLIAVLLLMWHRARQRANYYVSEVLSVAASAIGTNKASAAVEGKGGTTNG